MSIVDNMVNNIKKANDNVGENTNITFVTRKPKYHGMPITNGTFKAPLGCDTIIQLLTDKVNNFNPTRQERAMYNLEYQKLVKKHNYIYNNELIKDYIELIEDFGKTKMSNTKKEVLKSKYHYDHFYLAERIINILNDGSVLLQEIDKQYFQKELLKITNSLSEINYAALEHSVFYRSCLDGINSELDDIETDIECEEIDLKELKEHFTEIHQLINATIKKSKELAIIKSV